MLYAASTARLAAAWATRYESAKNDARHTAAKRAVDAAYSTLETLLEP